MKIQTSPNDRMLWALDNRGNVHVRVGITEEMPVGTAWEHIPGIVNYIISFMVLLLLYSDFIILQLIFIDV